MPSFVQQPYPLYAVVEPCGDNLDEYVALIVAWRVDEDGRLWPLVIRAGESYEANAKEECGTWSLHLDHETALAALKESQS